MTGRVEKRCTKIRLATAGIRGKALVAGLTAAVWATSRPALAIEASDIKPRSGLVLTTTVSATTEASGRSFGYLDTEDHLTLTGVDDSGLTYNIKVSAPGNQRLQQEASKLHWPRHVRRQDLEQSSRMTLLYASTDPENYAGQTFVETSRRVLLALKAGADVPFVAGAYSALGGDDPFAMLAKAANSQAASAAHPAARLAAPAGSGAPLIADPASLFGMLSGSTRTYYRGTLHRVEPVDVPVPVLVNGVRVSLPAVHARGTFSFGQQTPLKMEFWWLDNPDWPLTLHWTLGPGDRVLGGDVLTRIDWRVGDGDSEVGRLKGQLTGASCRVELHGIYFNTGSAELLEESEPMLKQVAALINASPDAHLTLEGHTDNIGSAEYNQTLSEQRAEAVRAALVQRYGVAAQRLSAKGYGLTRPVESNATVAGRARNRRVELSRGCAK